MPTSDVAKLGGVARSGSMTPEQRKELARKASLARWAKKAVPAPPPPPDRFTLSDHIAAINAVFKTGRIDPVFERQWRNVRDELLKIA